MNTNWQDLKREFFRRREDAIAARDRRKEEVYRKVPEIKILDQKITELGLSFTREAIKQDLPPESAGLFEQKIKELIEKRKNSSLITVFLPITSKLNILANTVMIPALSLTAKENPLQRRAIATASFLSNGFMMFQT